MPLRKKHLSSAKKALLDSGFEHALSDIQKSVNEVIAELAKEKGFTLAVPTSQILYADPSMDVSKEVLERLNKKLPTVTVKFDAPKAAEKK
jgi:Skp family chaperone for outer membrane proteins